MDLPLERERERERERVKSESTSIEKRVMNNGGHETMYILWY